VDTTEELELLRPLVLRLAHRHLRRPPRKTITYKGALHDVDNGLDDLIAAGSEGALRALENYNPEHGRLETFAYKHVDGAIRAAAAELGNTGWTIPEHVRAKLVEKRRALERLARAGNLEPERAEVADEMEIDDQEMDIVDGVSSNVASMDTFESVDTSDPEDDVPESMAELIPTDQRIDGWSAPWPSAEEQVEQAKQRAQIERFLAVLDPRQRDVVILFYGLNGGAMSATQIGQRLGGRRVTKQAVAKIVRGALAQMRVEAEVQAWAPEERKPRLTPTEDAFRAFMRRRVETTRRHRRYDEFDAENDIYMKER
jgi:RNA polymerase sigma factor (sigma-70 family)